jgi:hypothetical protein
MYAVFGTERVKRTKGFDSFLKGRIVSFSIRKENAYQLPALIEASDIFGGEIVVMLEQVGSDAEGRDVIKKYGEGMKNSKNLFILDEPFADANFVKTLTKYSADTVDAREEKVKEADPFSFVNAFALRDKKNAWTEWMKVRELDAEPIHGALWWKIKMLWQSAKDGRRSVFTEDELASIGHKLVAASHKAHRGEVDLKEEMEKLTLSL